MGKLKSEQVEEYFQDHVPYRLGVMLAHYRMTRTPWTGDVHQLDACFIAALIAGRTFVNMLGVRRKPDTNRLALANVRPTDIDVTDLGGKTINIAALPPAEVDLLEGFLRMADQ